MSAPLNNFIAVKYGGGSEPVEMHYGVGVTHAHPKHWHDEYLLCAITGGGGYTEYRGCAHFTPPGSLFVLPPGEVHSNYANGDGCSYTNIYLPSSRLQQVMAHIRPRDTELPPFVANESRLHAAFLRFCQDLENTPSRLQRDAAFLDFFQTLACRFGDAQTPNSSTEPQAVKATREFLDENFDQDIALEQLAQLAGLSPFHLNRIFRRRLGMPPHAYQIQLRISRAKEMLRNGFPIADVSHRTGFADQSHFTRHFKRMVGVTPGQFVPQRKNVQYLAFAAD